MTSKRTNRPLQFSLLVLLLCALCASSPLLSALNSSPSSAPARPKILQILQVRIFATNAPEANTFYYGILRTLALANTDATKCKWCEKISNGTNGPVVIDPVHGPAPRNLISAVVFKTDDAEHLRKSLETRKVNVENWTKWSSGAMFTVFDPEGHQLIFVQAPDSDQPSLGVPGAYQVPLPNWPHIIHAGFVVHDRAAMDRFYKDILGFHIYWQGGMHDGEINWVDMQVPDGTDWIEYMLEVPVDADQHTRGVMNHIALGVADMHRADDQLMQSNLHLPINEAPKIGRDGKWQLNLYDPDGTRVELMEFTPVEKPCCSEYTGPHPKP
jgi:catechol 2,3-dioxygenase-like lactoylglutathione lyase family enzyme